MFLLSSARPHEVPETIRSRCQTVTFRPLAESFIVETLVGEGVDEAHSRVSARLAGGNLGRARRIATDPDGLRFRDKALEALADARRGAGGALDAADRLLAEAAEYRKRLAVRLADELEPFLDPDTGRPVEQYRAAVRRMKERHHRQERRAEREFLDAALLGLQGWFRDALLLASGGEAPWAINLDRDTVPVAAPEAAAAVETLEQARAALADETNLNTRLVLEDAFLRLAPVGTPA
jgi:DNA polymerase-3 subunit delta'